MKQPLIRLLFWRSMVMADVFLQRNSNLNCLNSLPSFWRLASPSVEDWFCAENELSCQFTFIEKQDSWNKQRTPERQSRPVRSKSSLYFQLAQVVASAAQIKSAFGLITTAVDACLTAAPQALIFASNTLSDLRFRFMLANVFCL